jgi:Protein of unknown function (DUF1360)
VEAKVAEEITSRSDGADGGEQSELPEPQYTLFLSVYSLALAGLVWWRQRAGGLPDNISAGDLALIGVATHKGSRMLAKDKVTAPVRRPFARYEEPAGPGEVEESPRGSGLRYAIGELVVCPFCLSQWVATVFAAGIVVAPRATRFVASVLATVTASDFLQIAYKASEKRM